MMFFITGIASTCYEDYYFGDQYIEIDSLSLENFENTGETGPYNTDTISREAYMMTVSLAIEGVLLSYTRHNTGIFPSSVAHGNNSFILYDTIIGFRINTIDFFDNNHRAGSDLTDIFNAEFPGGHANNVSMSVEDKYRYYLPLPATEMIEELNNAEFTSSGNNIHLYLVSLPESTTNRFVVTMDLLDGRTLSDTTDIIYWR